MTLYQMFLTTAFLVAPLCHADIAPAAPEGNTGRYALSTASGTQAMVVTANHHATHAALSILKAGGSAIDAAIAAQAVLGLVEPQSSGIGGGAFIVYHDGDKTLGFDGRETAPASARENRFQDAEGKLLPFYSAIDSGLGVGIPGVLAALEAAHARHGKLDWQTLFTPAITLARQGFEVSPRLHSLIERDPLLQKKPGSRSYFFDKAGKPWPVGHRLRNPGYAKTLQRIARYGAIEFYQGKTARLLVKSLQQQGSDITLTDWSSYQPRISDALCHPYRQWQVCTAAAPSGGWTVLQTLAILEGFSREGNPALWLHRLLEAERLSFADRQRYSADPAFVPLPLPGLLASEYIRARRALISDKSMHTAEAGTPPGSDLSAGQDNQILENGTTQLVIADTNGHWLSMTSSIEDAFGSRLLVNGILFNNQLTDFSFSHVESARLLANRVQPGKRPRSAMSPVIVLDEKQNPVLATGSPGGSRIIGYVVQALTASLDDGLAPGEVVSLPLALSRNGPTEIDNDFPEELRRQLQDHGHEFRKADLNSGIALIRRNGEKLEGAADPRREGTAAGF